LPHLAQAGRAVLIVSEQKSSLVANRVVDEKAAKIA
jgi:hypothetical protein